jgi:hypothetical protein
MARVEQSSRVASVYTCPELLPVPALILPVIIHGPGNPFLEEGFGLDYAVVKDGK